jgi:tRNA (Thr-GGU) A37 N-methylase
MHASGAINAPLHEFMFPLAPSTLPSMILIENVDTLEGTPLLDIKSSVPMFDRYDPERIGWCANVTRRPRTTNAAGNFS